MVRGRFVRRDNRFRVTVEVGDELVAAHLPNSGRLTELLVAGRSCWLIGADNPRRKTRFDLTLVRCAETLVSVDARLPNRLFFEAWQEGCLAPFQDYSLCGREVRLGESRLDFRLDGPEGVCWVEVKSVTLVKDDVARFPDAPTARGVRHLQELTAVTCRGEPSAIVFFIQRDDARCFRPYDQADPAFAGALRRAAVSGVRVFAWTCKVTQREVTIHDQVPVDLA